MPEDVTPFAKLLLDYMWTQRPPLNISGLAKRAGVSKQTVSNWLNGRTVPQAGTLALLAQNTSIPIEAINEALGVQPTPAEQPDVWSYIVERIVTSGQYSDEEVAQIVEALRKLQADYEGNHSVSSAGSGKTAAALSSLMQYLLPAAEREDRGDPSPSGRVAEEREHYSA